MRRSAGETTPHASRPFMPGYGIMRAKRGMLPWSWAMRRIGNARYYWIATTRPDRRPHCVAVWGVWFAGAFYFSTGEQSRKRRNLAANPHIVVCVESGREAVSLEGAAVVACGRELIARVVAAYNRKYKTDYSVEMLLGLGPLFEVRPKRVLAFIDRPRLFVSTATRWEFPAEESRGRLQRAARLRREGRSRKLASGR